MPIIASATSGNAAGRTPPSPTFDVVASRTSLDETTDQTVTFNVTTTNLLDGTVLYYTLTGVNVNEFDFTSNSTFGNFTINNDAGSFSFTTTEDYFTEGFETVTISLRRGSITGQIVDQKTVVISDSSQDPTYTVTPSSTSVDEGSSFTFDVTTDKPIPGLVYYTLDGSGALGANLDDDDFVTVSYGIVSLDGASGGGVASSTTTINIEPDYITEGTELFVINIRSGGYTGGIYTTSESIQINDTADYPEVDILPSAPSVDEGSNIDFTFTTTGAPIGYTVYYAVSGVSTAADFDTSMSGSFTIDASGTNVVTLTPTLDQLTEGSETFSLVARTGAAATSYVLGTQLVPTTINDTSEDPTYTWTNVPSSINEGSHFSFGVTTTDIFDGTVLYWKIAMPSQTADFDAMNGSVTINNNTGTVTIRATDDQTTEGSETFYMSLYTDSSLDEQYNVANSASVTITDISQDPTYSIISPFSTPENVVAISTINTTDVFDGTTLYWEVASNTGATSADFSSPTGSSIVSVADTSILGIPGTATVSVSIANDFDNNEWEDYFVRVYTDSARTNLVATSSTTGISEPAFSWINAPGFAVYEGTTYDFDFNAPVAEGTTVYFQIRNRSEEGSSYGNSYDGDWDQPDPGPAPGQTFYFNNLDGEIVISGGVGTCRIKPKVDGSEPTWYYGTEYYRLVIWDTNTGQPWNVQFSGLVLDGGKKRIYD